MNNMLSWLYSISKNPFRSYTLAFMLMIITPLLMYPAAQANQTELIWFFIGIFVVANMLVLGIMR
jgi:hypothetical protein